MNKNTTMISNFTPQGFTEHHWANRPFKQNPSSIDELFRMLKEHERKLGFGKYLSGFIYYKDGCYSEYEDGSYSTKPAPHSKWWETELRSCHKGCCTKAPLTWDSDTRTYAKDDWQKGNYFKGVWRWCSCQKDKHPDDPFIEGECTGHSRSEPVPMQSYWIKPKAAQQGWQEFKRIGGLGGAEDQFKQIKRKEEVIRISLNGLGYFIVDIAPDKK